VEKVDFRKACLDKGHKKTDRTSTNDYFGTSKRGFLIMFGHCLNPTFADKADIEFIEPVADYFPPVLEPAVHPSGDSGSDTNLFDKSEMGKR
jgi:hypothetical protein